MIDLRRAAGVTADRRLPGTYSDPRLVVGACVSAVVVAGGLASGHVVLATLAAAAPMLTVTVFGGFSRLSRISLRSRMVALICLLLLTSTFVWRTRTTQALDSNPLDLAALMRIALVATAGILAFAFLLSPHYSARRIPVPLRFLGGYIIVAALSALGSPLPLQAFYRVFELGAGLLAIVVALLLLGDDAGPTILRLLMNAIGVIVAVIWIEALAFPSHGWGTSASIVPYELQGYLPSYSTNAVGTFGGLLALWGLAQPHAGRRGVLLANLTLAFGVITLLASQYRTGIIGFLIAGGIVAWYRRRRLFVVISAAAVLLVMFVGLSAVRAQTQTAFAKGRPELVGSLDSRTFYWHAAEPLIRQRPFLGWGLNVGSRRILVSLGDNTTSTIHGTWFEAVLGTGIVGASLLALAFLTALGHAWRVRRQPLGLAVAGMIVFFIVRSLTGPTAELFDISFLIFAALAFTAAQLGEVSRQRYVPTDRLAVAAREGQ